MVRIRFLSERDEVKGFYLLATRARLRGLPDGVYEIAKAYLSLLEQRSIKYTIISPTDVKLDKAQAARNPLTVGL